MKLWSLKNIIRGIGSVIDIFPEYGITRRSLFHRSDHEALTEDWNKVGQDIRSAFEIEKNRKEN